eukprot:5874906-Prymnesium_polylepis.1
MASPLHTASSEQSTQPAATNPPSAQQSAKLLCCDEQSEEKASIDPTLLRQIESERAAAINMQLCREATQFTDSEFVPPPELLDLNSLGTARPDRATHGPGRETKPFACGVRIAVLGLTVEQAVEQGEAV